MKTFYTLLVFVFIVSCCDTVIYAQSNKFNEFTDSTFVRIKTKTLYNDTIFLEREFYIDITYKYVDYHSVYIEKNRDTISQCWLYDFTLYQSDSGYGMTIDQWSFDALKKAHPNKF